MVAVAVLQTGPVQAMSSLKSEITSPLKNNDDLWTLRLLANTGLLSGNAQRSRFKEFKGKPP